MINKQDGPLHKVQQEVSHHLRLHVPKGILLEVSDARGPCVHVRPLCCTPGVVETPKSKGRSKKDGECINALNTICRCVGRLFHYTFVKELSYKQVAE